MNQKFNFSNKSALKSRPNGFYLIVMLFTLGLSLFTVYLINHLNNFNNELQLIEKNRLEMLVKADELRQSSDDLTRFARTYVITGNIAYKNDFYAVLSIRNGQSSRPKSYSQIYWDLLEPERSIRHPLREATSLYDEMKNLPYTQYEFGKLRESEANSNDLVNMEEEAFNAMLGIFPDQQGHYTITAEPDQEKAIQLLHSKAYHKAKHAIMLPIDEFIYSLNKRTQEEVDTIKVKISALFTQVFVILAIIILLVNLYLFAINKITANYLSALQLSAVDPLTQISNRLTLFTLGEQALAVAKRAHTPLSIMIIDIDFFKKINDTYGHIVGDDVLLHMVEVVNRSIRKSDIFARLGGEEFVVLLPGTGIEGVAQLADKIREQIEFSPFQQGKLLIPMTVSIGVAELEREKLLRELIHSADMALYTAKNTGRNTVTAVKTDF